MSVRSEVIERLIATGRKRIREAETAPVARAGLFYAEFEAVARADLGPALWPYVSPWAESQFRRQAAEHEVVLDIRVDGCAAVQARFLADGGPAGWSWRRAFFDPNDPETIWAVAGVGHFGRLDEALARAELAFDQAAGLEPPC